MYKNEQLPEKIIEEFVSGSESILGGNLVGIYLHGSSVMGCYNPMKSDLDFLVVVNDTVTDETKRAFMDMVVSLNDKTPGKGIEMSIVRREACDPFVHPMPFELHFSKGHVKWYKDDPTGYISTMKGTDRDLAAHCTIIRARGRCLKGCPIDEVFGEVPERDYADALWYDIEEAPEDILEDTMYITLNLARVMAWLRERKVLSKQEGGEWGLSNLPEEYRPLIDAALREYKGESVQYDLALAKKYAEELVGEMKEAWKKELED